jgi:hypothetical protein
LTGSAPAVPVFLSLTHTGHFSSVNGNPQSDSPLVCYDQTVWVAYITPWKIDLTMDAPDKIPPTARY